MRERAVRAILTALVAAALGFLPPIAARAFDAAACERFRALGNEDLAATMRAAGSARTSDRECFVRIAMLRLGMIEDEEFAAVPSGIIHRLVARDFATTPDDPLPEPVLRRYADDLLRAEPAPLVDPAARSAVPFEMINEDVLSEWDVVRGAPSADEAPVASTAGTLPGAEDGAEAPEPAATPPAAPGSEVAALPAPRDGVAGERRWWADSELGVLPTDVHLPRNTPPPHPRAAGRQAAPQPVPATPQTPAIEPAAAGPATAPAARGIAASGSCVEPADVRDPDIARNRRTIERAGLCLGVEAVREGVIGFVFTSVSNPHAPDGPVWYLPHDNEQEAFDAAVYAVAHYGGRMVAVNGDETRFYRSVDPNRFFAMTDADAAPCRMRRPTPAYTSFVMGLYEGRPEILSIHNNTRGGGVTVNVWDDKSRGFPVKAGPLADADHLVYIAGVRSVDDDAQARARRDALLAQGLNVVHERVTRANSDCSFSNHVVLNDGRPYYNVEAVHGSELQTRMVDRLMEILGYPRVPGG